MKKKIKAPAPSTLSKKVVIGASVVAITPVAAALGVLFAAAVYSVLVSDEDFYTLPLDD